MSKFLSLNMTDKQKSSTFFILEAFLDRGQNLEKLFSHDVYIDNTRTQNTHVPQMPEHA